MFLMASRQVRFPSPGPKFLLNLYDRNFPWNSAAHSVSVPRDRAPGAQHPGDSIVGAKPNGEDAGNCAGGHAAGWMDVAERHGKIRRGGETSGGCADRNLLACGFRK